MSVMSIIASGFAITRRVGKNRLTETIGRGFTFRSKKQICFQGCKGGGRRVLAGNVPERKSGYGTAVNHVPLPLKTDGAHWISLYSTLVSAVKVRHYTSKTRKAHYGLIHHLRDLVKYKEQKVLEL
jgi:hypothetical protein